MNVPRTLPHDLDAERSVLGAILINDSVYVTAASRLHDGMFFRDAHRRIFAGMATLHSKASAIDLVTLKGELERTGDLEEVGGPAYLASLVDGVPQSTNVACYADQVVEQARLRRLIFDASKAVTQAYEREDSAEIAHGLRAELEVLNAGPAESEAGRQAYLITQETQRERARREARRAVDLAELGGGDPPVFQRLDDLLRMNIPPVEYVIDRLQPKGSKVLFAAQAKAGKTTTVLNLIRSLVDGVPFLGQFNAQAPAGNVCLIDLEMSASQLPRWFKDADIQNADRVRVVQLRGRARDFNLLNPNTLARWAADLKRENIGYLIFDNLRPLLDSCGLDENKDAGRFLVLFDRLIAEAGISASMIIHHMGHNGDRSRGDSRLRDWPDVEWKLTRQRGATGEVEDPDSPRFFSCYGRDVHQPEAQLAYDSSRRHLLLVGGNRQDSAVNEAIALLYDRLGDRRLTKSGLEAEGNALGIGRGLIRSAIKTGVTTQVFHAVTGQNNAQLISRGTGSPVRHGSPTSTRQAGSPFATPYKGGRTGELGVIDTSSPLASGGSHVEL